MAECTVEGEKQTKKARSGVRTAAGAPKESLHYHFAHLEPHLQWSTAAIRTANPNPKPNSNPRARSQGARQNRASPQGVVSLRPSALVSLELGPRAQVSLERGLRTLAIPSFLEISKVS